MKWYPLTTIIDIVYNEAEDPFVFKLVFEHSVMLLESPDMFECKLWVMAIRKGNIICFMLCSSFLLLSWIFLHVEHKKCNVPELNLAEDKRTLHAYTVFVPYV